MDANIFHAKGSVVQSSDRRQSRIFLSFSVLLESLTVLQEHASSIDPATILERDPESVEIIELNDQPKK